MFRISSISFCPDSLFVSFSVLSPCVSSSDSLSRLIVSSFVSSSNKLLLFPVLRAFSLYFSKAFSNACFNTEKNKYDPFSMELDPVLVLYRDFHSSLDLSLAILLSSDSSRLSNSGSLKGQLSESSSLDSVRFKNSLAGVFTDDRM
jgi:hypothetical protein